MKDRQVQSQQRGVFQLNLKLYPCPTSMLCDMTMNTTISRRRRRVQIFTFRPPETLVDNLTSQHHGTQEEAWK